MQDQLTKPAALTPTPEVRRTRWLALIAVIVGVGTASFAAGMTVGSPGRCSDAPTVIISPTPADAWLPVR